LGQDSGNLAFVKRGFVDAQGAVEPFSGHNSCAGAAAGTFVAGEFAADAVR